MDRISQLIKRVSSFNDALSSCRLIQGIILDNEAYIVDMNSEEQLYEHGENALGVSISDYQPYSPITIQIKRSKGQPTNRVTLRDEGDFYRSFYIEAGADKFEIRANDWKTEHLQRKYGKDILGLNEANIELLIREYILPELLEIANQRIHG